MTDIRERHLPYAWHHDPDIIMCEECDKKWPCDAITEHEAHLAAHEMATWYEGRAIEAEAKLQDCIAESALLDGAMERHLEAEARADKAEAALAGCERSNVLAGATNRIIQDERDAARADADALAAYGNHSVACPVVLDAIQPFFGVVPDPTAHATCTCGWSAALAAHEEATR